MIVPGQLCAQADKIAFEHLQTRDTPYCLLQDHYGFIWFGSQYDGLHRYDGYDFLAYRNDADDEHSLSENSVRALAEDEDGNLWIGTIGGLNKFDRITGKFQRFLHDSLRADSPSQNYITAIYIDKAGVIWFGTQEGGLNEAKALKSKQDGSDSLVCRHYVHDPNDPQSISHNNVKAIWEHSHRFENSVWIGTAFGLNRLDKKTKKFTRYIHDPTDSTSLRHNEVWSIHEEEAGALWIGTHAGGLSRLSTEDASHIKFQNFGLGVNQSLSTISSDRSRDVWIGTPEHGLFRFNLQTRKITNFMHQDDDPNSLWTDNISSVMIDKFGALWIGRRDGIDKYDLQQKKFHNIPIKPPPKIWAIAITSFCEDRSGFTWIGTDKRGLFKWDPSSGQMTNYDHVPDDAGSLCCQFVLTVYEDKTGILWIGTIDGLDWFDRKTEKFHHLNDDPLQPDSPNRLLSDYIYTLYEDKHGRFWISTPRGLSKLDRATGRFTHYLNDADNQIGRAGYCIGVIYESKNDGDSTFWIGANGLFKFNPQTGQLARYFHDPDNPNSWINQLVYGIQQDKTGNLWVATTGGLYCLRTDKTVAHFTVKEGLPHNITCGILEDEAGLLWISTYQGLIRYDPQSRQLRRYEMREGFLKNEFCMGAYSKGRSGYLYFGQLNGFKMFHPRQIKDNPYTPPVWITDFRVFDQPVSFDRPIPDLKEIRLSYKQNFFTLDFVALNYTESQKNQYAYQLEGVDPDWVHCGTRRSASYTNIPPGKYLFKVKGSNNDGVWNEQGTSVWIIITPPWWRSQLAFGCYFLIFLAILLGLRQFELRRSRLRGELKMRRFESQKLQEIDSMKSRFFANISHEFRTPLTLILGPLSKMLAQAKSKEKKQEFKLMQRNAQRLQRLINQLLDLSKIEAGKMTLQSRPENIVALLNRIVQSFESQAKLKGIELKFQSEQDEIIAYVDREKMENIFYNLLSNAMKFTPQGGTVCVTVNIPLNPPSKGDFRIPPFEGGPGGMSGYIQITVSDTGIGIPSDRLDKVFDRFYQVDDSYTREHEGSGIGLALTKELVDLHHGKIEVRSELNKGTTFTVYLPLGKEHFKPEEIVDKLSESSELSESLKLTPEEQPSESSELSEGFVASSPRKALPLVLIVEDNRDMRSYLQDCLASNYRVIEAVDGADGLHRATDKIPDLIISDVMMPRMDGFQMCERVKSDERTSHIPVILLTARATAESKIKGLELGADDYLIKPFDRAELQVRVRNLIEQRRKLRERFSRDISLPPKEIAVTSYDEKFLLRAIAIIEQHLSNPDFDVTILTREIGMSRMQLHRKLRALTNQSTNKFIRSLRLKKAADLLNQKYGNVAQIAYEVGFNNPAYFAECFRKQFGKLPSEYVREIG